MSSARPRAQSQRPNVGLQCRLLALFQHGAMSDLSPLSGNLGNADRPLAVMPACRDLLIRAQLARVDIGPGSAEQRDRTMRSLSSGAHSRDPLASPGARCTGSGTRAEFALVAVR
jgi:hypothetical protein